MKSKITLTLIISLFTLFCWGSDPTTCYKTLSEMPLATMQKVKQEADSSFTIKVNKHGWIGVIKYVDDGEKLAYRSHSDTTYHYLCKKIVIRFKNTHFGKTNQKTYTREAVRLMPDEKYEDFALYGCHLTELTEEKVVISFVITHPDTDVGDIIEVIMDKNGIKTVYDVAFPD